MHRYASSDLVRVRGEPAGELARSGESTELLSEGFDGSVDLAAEVFQPSRYPDSPLTVPEVSEDFSADGGDGERNEVVPVVGLVSVDREDERHERNLFKVRCLLSPSPTMPAGDVLGNGQMTEHQFVAQRDATGIGHAEVVHLSEQRRV
jgi:hypothetical protein